jgi:hypothetical protein
VVSENSDKLETLKSDILEYDKTYNPKTIPKSPNWNEYCIASEAHLEMIQNKVPQDSKEYKRSLEHVCELNNKHNQFRDNFIEEQRKIVPENIKEYLKIIDSVPKLVVELLKEI